MEELKTYRFVCTDCQGEDEPCELKLRTNDDLKNGPYVCPMNGDMCDWLFVSESGEE